MKWKIPQARPDITDLERKAVIEVLKTPNLSLGSKTKEFEEKIAEFTGVKYSVAVNSGTSALHLVIRSLEITKGDEVITTPFSFIASANCILFEKAKPIFVDIDSKTLNIDAKKIEEKITKRTKAILAVDVFGHPADWNELEKIAQKHRLFLIEDSAEALGSEYNGKKCGSFGDAAVFAFYPNKQITTGEGGVINTNSKKIAELSQSMANQGRKLKGGKWLEHVRLGYNYRIDEMSAALGLAQLKRIKEILKKREKVVQMYNRRLKDLSGIELPYIEPGVKVNWFVYVIRLNPQYTKRDRDKIIGEMAKKKIHTMDYFQCIHLQPFYRKLFGHQRGDFPIAESASDRTIALPFYNSLKEKEIKFVVENLQNLLSKLNKSK